VALAEIAARQQISLSYLEQLFARLRRKGLVVSARGPGGGYRLAREARDTASPTSSWPSTSPCAPPAAACPRPGPGKGAPKGCMAGGAQCLTHDLWEEMGRQIHGYLASVSVADVLAGKLKERAQQRKSQGDGGRVSKPSIYLDYNATAPIRPEARDAVLRAFESAGNPSSVHASGRAARDLVETARAQVGGPGRGRAGLGHLRQRRHRGQRPGHRQRRLRRLQPHHRQRGRARRRARDRRRLGPAGRRCRWTPTASPTWTGWKKRSATRAGPWSA
jgi:Rrf2 family iron-sulfur cluster assembly transcriptional regulator